LHFSPIRKPSTQKISPAAAAAKYNDYFLSDFNSHSMMESFAT
jgi:hypothetical protein